MKIIESITIRYFRSIYTLTLSDCQDLTVITGKNDVGKSNIIKALNLFFCQQSDYLQNFNFTDDYSILRLEDVKKETIRGQRFISISIRFLRGNRMEKSLPPSFTVTKRWDMHSPDCKTSSDVQARMQQYAKKSGLTYSEKITATSLSTFLNKIKFIYIPAIKDDRVFSNTLNLLQESLFDSRNKQILDAPIGEANKAIQNIVGDLQADFKKSTGISNFIELPNTLNYTNGLLQINTQAGNGIVTIDKHGDGIRTHYIPKILNYVSNNSRYIYIWGFEEPENSYEYRRCLQVSQEFDNEYSKRNQIFITSHSPAFFDQSCGRKAIIRVGFRDGKTTILSPDGIALDEELGYIELYKDYIRRVQELEAKTQENEEKLSELKALLESAHTPILLTEGKTDADLLKLAIQHLNLTNFASWTIKPMVSGQTKNNESLLKYLQELRDNTPLEAPVIGMFDRDTPLLISNEQNQRVDIRDHNYVKFGKNIYAFSIPVPHNRLESDQISIEHYFTDEEIKTAIDGKRLFMGNEFYSTGIFIAGQQLFYKGARNVAGTIKIIEHETNNYVTNPDGTGDYSISKARFVENIQNECADFKDFSFDEFQKIFDILAQIYQDSLGPTTP